MEEDDDFDYSGYNIDDTPLTKEQAWEQIYKTQEMLRAKVARLTALKEKEKMLSKREAV